MKITVDEALNIWDTVYLNPGNRNSIKVLVTRINNLDQAIIEYDGTVQAKQLQKLKDLIT